MIFVEIRLLCVIHSTSKRWELGTANHLRQFALQEATDLEDTTNPTCGSQGPMMDLDPSVDVFFSFVVFLIYNMFTNYSLYTNSFLMLILVVI